MPGERIWSKRILIVDHNISSAEWLSEQAGKRGFKGRIIEDPITAQVELYRSVSRFQGMFVAGSVSDPNVRKFTTIARIQTHSPLILVTDKSSRVREQDIVDAGFDHYLVRPFSTAALDMTFSILPEIRRLRQLAQVEDPDFC